VVDIVQDIVNEFFIEKGIDKQEKETYKSFVVRLQSVFPVENIDDIYKAKDKVGQIQELTEAFYKFYMYRKHECPPGLFEDAITKRTLLFTLDKKWMDHLHNMDILREGIGLRAWGQKDPLIEYKMEGFDMFKAMLLNVAEEAMSLINRYVLVGDSNEMEEDAIEEPATMYYNKSDSNDGGVMKTQRKTDKVGRNEPCPCGSGRKYKKCCMS
jgi:preprotein translocase subunit SecA